VICREASRHKTFRKARTESRFWPHPLGLLRRRCQRPRRRNVGQRPIRAAREPKEFDMHISPINDPSAWFAKDLETNGKWIYHLNQGEIDDLDNALAVAKAAGRTVATVDRKSFPLSVMPAALDKLLDALENGYGVYVIRGLPVEKY